MKAFTEGRKSAAVAPVFGLVMLAGFGWSGWMMYSYPGENAPWWAVLTAILGAFVGFGGLIAMCGHVGIWKRERAERRLRDDMRSYL